jgi:hypothetical protein
VDRSGTMRVTIEEASRLLGIEKASVRKRVQRGKLRSERDASGTLYVYVDESETVRDRSETVRDRSETVRDRSEDLTSELRDRLRYVEDQLEAERRAHAEARRIIAGLVERIPALEAPAETPPEPPGASESAAEVADRGHGPQEQERRAQRPWWRRWFGS